MAIADDRDDHKLVSCLLTMACLTSWLTDGPKLAKPSLEVCRALCEVEVGIEPKYYRQPYRCLMVALPPEMFSRYKAVGINQITSDVVSLHAVPYEVTHGEVTTAMNLAGTDLCHNKPTLSIEDVIQTFTDPAIAPEEREEVRLAWRIAINLCLLMTNYGTKTRYLLDKEVERDRSLVKRGNKDARVRVATAIQLVTVGQDIELFRTSRPASKGEYKSGSHASPEPHWRKGHWRTQHHGQGNSLTKQVYIAPVFVLAGNFAGELSDTSATYKG